MGNAVWPLPMQHSTRVGRAFDQHALNDRSIVTHVRMVYRMVLRGQVIHSKFDKRAICLRLPSVWIREQRYMFQLALNG